MGVTDVSEKDSDIWEKVYHTDARVTAMEGQLSDVSGAVSRIEQHLLNKPEPNVTAWIGIAFGVLTFIVGLLWVVVQYVHLNNEPIQETMAARGEVLQEYTEFKHQTHYEFGGIHEWKAAYDTRLVKDEAEFNSLKERIRVAETGAAVTANRLQKVESEIDKIDLYGSRRWTQGEGSAKPSN